MAALIANLVWSVFFELQEPEEDRISYPACYFQETALDQRAVSMTIACIRSMYVPEVVRHRGSKPWTYCTRLPTATLAHTLVHTLLADLTNHYALPQGTSGWKPVTASELWTFLDVILFIGVHILPHLKATWVVTVCSVLLLFHKSMSRARCRQLLHHLHLYDEASCNHAA